MPTKKSASSSVVGNRKSPVVTQLGRPFRDLENSPSSMSLTVTPFACVRRCAARGRIPELQRRAHQASCRAGRTTRTAARRWEAGTPRTARGFHDGGCAEVLFRAVPDQVQKRFTTQLRVNTSPCSPSESGTHAAGGGSMRVNVNWAPLIIGSPPLWPNYNRVAPCTATLRAPCDIAPSGQD